MIRNLFLVSMAVKSICDGTVHRRWGPPQEVLDMLSTDIDVEGLSLGVKGSACVDLRTSKRHVVGDVYSAVYRHRTLLVNPETGALGSFNHTKYVLATRGGDIVLTGLCGCNRGLTQVVYSGTTRMFQFSGTSHWLTAPPARSSGGNKSIGVRWHKTTYLDMVTIPVHQVFTVMFYGRLGLDATEAGCLVRETNHRNGNHQDNRLVNLECIFPWQHVAHKELLGRLRKDRTMFLFLFVSLESGRSIN